MKLNGLLLEFGAVLSVELECFVVAIMGVEVLLQPGSEMLVESFVSERFFAIRATESIHLEQTEVNAKLNFFLTVFAFEAPNNYLPCLVFPVVEQVRYIEVHCIHYWQT